MLTALAAPALARAGRFAPQYVFRMNDNVFQPISVFNEHLGTQH